MYIYRLVPGGVILSVKGLVGLQAFISTKQGTPDSTALINWSDGLNAELLNIISNDN